MNRNGYDPRMEFFSGLDEFCQEKHFWWRRKAASFQVLPNIKQYDLSSNGTGQANATDLVEIEEMFIVNSNPQPYPYSVQPEFNARQQIAAIYGSQSVGNAIPRTGYFLLPGGFQTLELGQEPNQTFAAAFTYYACPMVTDTTIDAIPLVPPNLHFGLFYMLERRFYEILFGEEDPRYQVADARYERFLLTAAKSKSFSSQESISMSTNRGAVQAQGGRGYRAGRGR